MRNVKYLIVFYDMIADMLSNKKQTKHFSVLLHNLISLFPKILY